jgi:hypothetical protein
VVLHWSVLPLPLLADVVVVVALTHGELPHMYTLFDDWRFKQSVA